MCTPPTWSRLISHSLQCWHPSKSTRRIFNLNRRGHKSFSGSSWTLTRNKATYIMSHLRLLIVRNCSNIQVGIIVDIESNITPQMYPNRSVKHLSRVTMMEMWLYIRQHQVLTLRCWGSIRKESLVLKMVKLSRGLLRRDNSRVIRKKKQL